MKGMVVVLLLGASLASAAPLRRDCHGRALCQSECAAGIGASCLALAKMTPAKASELQQRGCALGDYDACHALFSGERYRQWDDEVRRTLTAALAAAHEQCARGDGLVCRSYASLTIWAFAAGELPRGVMHEAIEHARALFLRGCDAGDGRACAELGSAVAGATDLNDHIVTSDDARGAWALYEKACAGGYGRGCTDMEWAVRDHFLALSADEVSERRWELMNEGCDKGDGRECERAGDLSEDHHADAVARYQKGCALDDAPSCGKLAWSYGDGRHGAQLDRKRALVFAEKSCDADYQSGCVMLARLLRATDRARARRLLAEACRREPAFTECERRGSP